MTRCDTPYAPLAAPGSAVGRAPSELIAGMPSVTAIREEAHELRLTVRVGVGSLHVNRVYESSAHPERTCSQGDHHDVGDEKHSRPHVLGLAVPLRLASGTR